MTTDSAPPSSPPFTNRPRAWRWSSFGAVAKHVVLIGVVIALLYPLAWMVSSSFKFESDIFREISLLPDPATVQNYIDGWTGIPGYTFARFYLNTGIICLFSVVGNVLTCSAAAYAFARFDFRGRRFFFASMLLTVMIPAQVILIPQYIVYFQLGWVDTFLPLVVPKWLAMDAFFVFLMAQFIRGLPRELEDSARIDGCGELAVYWRIVMPLAFPALLTTAFFTFVWAFDDFFNQLIFLNSTSNYTVAVSLVTYVDSSGQSQWGQLFAMSVLSLVPVTVAFLLMQRRLVEGIATTGIKG